jgi:hypothetical protein
VPLVAVVLGFALLGTRAEAPEPASPTLPEPEAPLDAQAPRVEPPVSPPPPVSPEVPHDAAAEDAWILGRVVDPTGRGVGPVEVVATPIPAGPPARSAFTDATGSFALEGLCKGQHRLKIRSAAWRVPPDGVRERPALLVWTGLHVEIVVAPVRLAHVLLLDARDERPVGSALVVAALVPEGHARTTHVSLARRAPAGVLRAVVDLDPGGPDPREARLRVSADGYRPMETVVPLLAGDATSEDPPHAVRLEPLTDEPSGEVLLLGPREVTTLARSPHTLLAACRPEDGAELRLHGEPAGPDETLFRRVPPGTWRATAFDGLSVSAPFEVVVRAGERSHADASFPAPTGLVVHLVDRAGTRLFDADAVLLARPGQAHDALDVPAITRLEEGPDGPLDVLQPLEPGPWRCLVHLEGHAIPEREIEVRPGEVATLRVTLEGERP